MKISKAEKARRQAALKLSPTRVRLARDVIGKARDYRGGANGCDEFDWPNYMTDADINALVVDFSDWNGDPENADSRDYIGWGGLFGYLTAALLKMAEDAS